MIGVIGFGRMGGALIKALLEAKISRMEQLIVSDSDAKRLKEAGALGIEVAKDNCEVARRSDILVIAVKPKDVDGVLKEIGDCVSGKLVVSIAAGVTTRFIEKRLRSKARVIRVMPNIACLMRQAASVYCLGRNATADDGKLVGKLFGGVGLAIQLPEELIDAVTGLSGSGPAFFFLAMKALAEAGVEEGIPKESAAKLAAQTAKGAGEMALRMGLSLDELIGMVASPGGTTERGLEALKNGKVAESFKEALKAATKRSRELGRQWE